MAGEGGVRWWQGMVTRGGGRSWWQGVVAWGGGKRWWQEVVTGGSVQRWWQWVVAKGSGRDVVRARVRGAVSRAWQNRLLSARDSKLILMQRKLGVPSSLSIMLIWCGCDDMHGPLPVPVTAIFIAVVIAFTLRPRSPPQPSICCGEVASGQTTIE